MHVNAMKTITIKDEVYEELRKLKREGESFSDVIMRLLKRREVDLLAFYGAFSDRETWREIEEEILADRRRTVAR